MSAAIRTDSLTKSYGETLALNHLDMEVREGEIFGFLGPNGAGKTTTIRLLVDLLRPDSGSVRVLGLDPRADGTALRRRIGYLPDDFVVGTRQTANHLLTYLGNLRGGRFQDRIEVLAGRLGLDLTKKIGDLSRGSKQKVGLVQAFMHDPELLILDEPTAALDPLVAREVLGMATEARDIGQTVFMSSHILSEVQAIADRAGIIRKGRLIEVGDIEELRSRSMRNVEVVFDGPVSAAEFEGVEGVDDLQVEDGRLRCRLVGEADTLVKAVARHRVIDFVSEEPDLEELFFHYYEEEAADAR